MHRKIIVLFLLAASAVTFLPARSNAAVVTETIDLVNTAAPGAALFLQVRSRRSVTYRRWRNRNSVWSRSSRWNRRSRRMERRENRRERRSDRRERRRDRREDRRDRREDRRDRRN